MREVDDDAGDGPHDDAATDADHRRFDVYPARGFGRRKPLTFVRLIYAFCAREGDKQSQRSIYDEAEREEKEESFPPTLPVKFKRV